MTDRAILTAIFSFALGVLISSFFFVPPLISVLIIVVGLAILLAEKVSKSVIGAEALALVFILIFFGLGGLRYAIKDFHEIAAPSGTGIVISEPEDRENARRFVMMADNGEKVLVSTELYSPVQYGDRVEAEGELERPGIIDNSSTGSTSSLQAGSGQVSGRPFDYGKYLAKDDIYWTLGFAEVKVVSSGHGNPIKSALFQIKRSFVSQAKEILAEPYAGLLAGLLVSGKESLPKDILELFRRAGIIHIVVLSGFNITLIAEFMRRVFQGVFIYARLPAIPQAAAAASATGIILFVIMTGAEATVVRAAIMALIVIAAKVFGGAYSATRALVFAAFLMLIHNPKILAFDSSFQLSFLATLGLIHFMPPIERRLRWAPEKFKIREIVSQTLATQLAVFPLLIHISGTISPVFLPANILALIAVPWTMLIGFIAVMVSYLSIAIAWPITFAAHLLLSWILLVGRIFGNF